MTIKTKVQNKLLQRAKAFYHLVRFERNHAKTVLFIVGCQRSGTTLVNEILLRDFHSKVYAEQSKLSSLDAPKRLRLDPLDSVKAVLDQDRAPLVIVKPLVESQNILQLLSYFEGSKALWMYRHYRDVAASHVKKWGDQNSIRDLRAIVEQRENHWCYENVPAEVRETVLQHFSEEMNGYDAAALYWFVRNSFFFNLHLDTNPMVMLCKYEELVADPVEVMQEVYGFLGHDFPGKRIVANVHMDSVQKGKSVQLASQIECLCDTLLSQLDHVYMPGIHPARLGGLSIPQVDSMISNSVSQAESVSNTSVSNTKE
jgi:hypothetical protein